MAEEIQMEIHEVHYQRHVFGFARDAGELFAGRLLLDETQRALLVRLNEGEDEDWYLDEQGWRLPAEQLFARSPWSCRSETGTVKLLCRLLDYNDGRVLFSTPESYS